MATGQGSYGAGLAQTAVSAGRCTRVTFLADSLWLAVLILAAFTVLMCLRVLSVQMEQAARWQARFAEAQRLREAHQQHLEALRAKEARRRAA